VKLSGSEIEAYLSDFVDTKSKVEQCSSQLLQRGEGDIFMSRTPLTSDERREYGDLNSNGRLALARQYSKRLRLLARTIATTGRSDMISLLQNVAFNLHTMAEEIAAGSTGIQVLARAARLIDAAEECVADYPPPATLP
jgi:hypothetical protein